MNVDSLQLFIDVARRLSFTAVADDRGIDPSSVSRSVAQLERQLGVRLLQRTTRSMTLTEAGETFLVRIAGVVEELEAATELARATGAAPSGTLRLTASTAFGERVIVPLLPAFRREFPDITLDLAFTDANVDLVAEGIDLAIRLGPRRGGDVVASRLFPTTYRVVASPDYVARSAALGEPGDLAHHACVTFPMPAYRSEWQFRPRPGGDPWPVAIAPGLVISSAMSLRSAVIGGAGPALLADWLIGDDIAAGRLVDLFPAFEATATDFESAAWLMYPSRAFLPRKTRAMIDFLGERLRNDARARHRRKSPARDR